MNLVVVHLESLSNVLFDEYASSLPKIAAMRERGWNCSNFISTATSTAMVKASFFFGEDCPQDHFRNFDDPNCIDRSNHSHLFGILRNQGYQTTRLVYPECWTVDQERVITWGIWTQDDGMAKYIPDRDQYFADMISACPQELDWAVYLHPLIAHVAYTDEIKGKATTPAEYIDLGYRFMDEMVSRLHDHLDQTGQLERTLWVFFGDHGDAFYTRSFNSGMCHGSEPYLPMVQCPYFIVGPNIPVEKTSKLFTAADCKKTILHLLDIEEGFPVGRAIAFSQNQFMNQSPGRVLNKAFMAYDGQYLLIVSSLGLEMYDCRFDRENHNNILSFFSLRQSKELKFKKAILNTAHPHFKKLFTEIYRKEISDHFISLRRSLIEWISMKEARLGKDLREPFPRRYFRRIRRRSYYWRYPIQNSQQFFSTVREHWNINIKRARRLFSSLSGVIR